MLCVKIYLNFMQATFTISELESITGTRRRTIHFYVQQGLLPAPMGTGGSARYGEEHILRLIIIREMQNSHLKLTGIREALDAMSIDEMKEIAKTAGGPNITWDSNSIGRWVAHTGKDVDFIREQGSPYMNVGNFSVSEPDEAPASFSFLDALDKARSRGNPKGSVSQSNPAAEEKRKLSSGEAAQWERINLADGVELHVRSDRHDRHRTKIDRIIDYCRKLF